MTFRDLDTAMQEHIKCVKQEYQVFVDWVKTQGDALDKELNVEDIKQIPNGCMLLMVIVIEDLICKEREENR